MDLKKLILLVKGDSINVFYYKINNMDASICGCIAVYIYKCIISFAIILPIIQIIIMSCVLEKEFSFAGYEMEAIEAIKFMWLVDAMFVILAMKIKGDEFKHKFQRLGIYIIVFISYIGANVMVFIILSNRRVAENIALFVLNIIFLGLNFIEVMLIKFKRLLSNQGVNYIDLQEVYLEVDNNDIVVEIMTEENNIDDICSICLEQYEEGNSMGKLICGHIFHELCIKESLKRKYTCPLCRKHSHTGVIEADSVSVSDDETLYDSSSSSSADSNNITESSADSSSSSSVDSNNITESSADSSINLVSNTYPLTVI